MSLEKKLKQAYTHGIEDGFGLILRAIKETKGVGPILEARIIDKANELALEKVKQG